MGTQFFIAVGGLPVYNYKLTKFQRSLLQIEQDSLIYTFDVMLG